MATIQSMRLVSDHLLTIEFKEHPVKNFQTDHPGEYDLTTRHFPSNPDFIYEGGFSEVLYCKALLAHLYEFPSPKRKKFLDFQCTLMKDPIEWLSTLDKLLEMNLFVLSNQNREGFAYEARDYIEEKIEALENPAINVSQAEGKINLPADFKLSSLGLKIDKLDIYQTAILFHFLKEHHAFLDYNNEALAKFAHYLTGHSEQNLRTDKGFGEIQHIIRQDRKEEKFYDLKVVKKFLEEILDDIESITKSK